MSLQEYKEKIIKAIEVLNAEPSIEHLGEVEDMIDFYSDCYKDEYYVRPRNDIGYFRSLYNDVVMSMYEDWNNNL